MVHNQLEEENYNEAIQAWGRVIHLINLHTDYPEDFMITELNQQHELQAYYYLAWIPYKKYMAGFNSIHNTHLLQSPTYQGDLEELPTRKAHIVETLLLGAVITLLVSRRLLLAVQERLRRTPYKMPEQRWAAIFAAAAPAILDIVVLPPRVSKVIARRLESMLLHEAPDPNRSRQLLIERVECGAAWA